MRKWVILALIITCAAREVFFRINSLAGNLVTFPIMIALLWISLSNYVFRMPILIGSSMNWLAMLSNGGKMPYVGNFSCDAFHIKISSAARLRILCDIIPLGGQGSCSIGDILIYTGVAIFFFEWFWARPWKKLAKEV